MAQKVLSLISVVSLKKSSPPRQNAGDDHPEHALNFIQEEKKMPGGAVKNSIQEEKKIPADS